MAGEQFKGNPEKQIREYNAGDFQTTDPVTGEPRNEPLPDKVPQPVEQHNPNAPQVDAADYEASTKDDLQAEADRRNLTVKGSGSGGAVLKEDLVKALRKADRR